jgi:photosystem II stability/assembly factor-like uncharacterized protein
MLRVSSCSYLHVSVIRLTLLVLSIIGGANYLGQQANQGTKTLASVKEPDSQETTNSRAETGEPVGYPLMTNSAFVGADRVWLVDSLAGALQRSVDGGKNWQKLTADQLARRTVLSFIDQEMGWRLGTSSSGDACYVWSTIDGGKNWTKISNIGPFLIPIQLHFADRSHGWFLETDSVWRTEDGGVSWVEVLSASDPRLKGRPVQGFFMNDRQAWIAGGAGQVYATADGGKTWNIQTVGEDSSFSDIFFVDEQTGWVGRTSEGQLYRTDDGGRSWQSQPAPGHEMYLDSFYFLSKNEGWAVGQQLLEVRPNMMPIEYISKGLVQAILLHTVDGGKTWQPSLIGKSDAYFGRVYFSDSKQGWVLSPKTLYRTHDGGRTWQVARRLKPIVINTD